MNATEKRWGTVLRCYDNGGKTCDRYTIVPPRWAHEYRERAPGLFTALAANAEPFHPQGFGQHTTAQPGPHLGRRVHWTALPADVQTFARQSFPEYAPIGDGKACAGFLCRLKGTEGDDAAVAWCFDVFSEWRKAFKLAATHGATILFPRHYSTPPQGEMVSDASEFSRWLRGAP